METTEEKVKKVDDISNVILQAVMIDNTT